MNPASRAEQCGRDIHGTDRCIQCRQYRQYLAAERLSSIQDTCIIIMHKIGKQYMYMYIAINGKAPELNEPETSLL